MEKNLTIAGMSFEKHPKDENLVNAYFDFLAKLKIDSINPMTDGISLTDGIDLTQFELKGSFLLTPVISEAIINDAQIIALNQKLNQLCQFSSPTYVMKTDGKISAVNSEQFDKAFTEIIEQIELRQRQIVAAYNWH